MSPPRSALLVEGCLTIRPADGKAFQRFVDDFMVHERPVLERSGIEIVGAWERLTDPGSTLLHLYRFDSLTTMHEAGRKMRRDPGAAAIDEAYRWIDDPDFSYRRLLGALAPFASIDKLNNPAPPVTLRDWVEVRQTVRFLKQADAFPLLAEQFAAWEAKGLFELGTAYDTIHGQFGEVVTFGALAEGVESPDELFAATPADIRAGLDAVLQRGEAHLLRPLEHSPLA